VRTPLVVSEPRREQSQNIVRTITDHSEGILEILDTRYTGLYLDDGERTSRP